ncbi:MAG TPA: hypothetical protein VGR78_13450 [Verrucomicrobiae bacterium]|jgi:hypothetical protein|nr:hypothetical protein [Verrucomicrobiae bacterium]
MVNKIEKTQPFRGEYIGNRPESVLDLVGPNKKTLRDKYAIGEPRDCAAGTADQMRQRGFVGIYHKSPSRIFRLAGSDLVPRGLKITDWVFLRAPFTI